MAFGKCCSIRPLLRHGINPHRTSRTKKAQSTKALHCLDHDAFESIKHKHSKPVQYTLQMFYFCECIFCQGIDNVKVGESKNTKNSFTFVMIPADKDAPIKELVRPKLGLNHDAIEKYARAYFGFSDDSVCVCMHMCVGVRLRCMDVQGNM